MKNSWAEPSAGRVILAASVILMVTLGIRHSLGLFVSPINTATGLGIVAISLALAVGQLVWGVVQPVAGALADRYGPGKVLIVGLVMLGLGVAATPFATTSFALVIVFGVLMSSGAGIASFSVIMGAASQRLPPSRRANASGVINAGASFGQFIVAPVAQALIQWLGWVGALWSLATLAFAAIPFVGGVSSPLPTDRAKAIGHSSHWQAVREAMADRSYLLLHAGFFTCGFHISFLMSHLPGEVNLCGLAPSVASWSLAIIGLANVVGSLLAGALSARYRSKFVLAGMYASRALIIGWYLIAPKTEWTFYLFAVALGLTWLSTIPPTATIVGKLFGVRYLATLFGLTLLSHQVGGFMGAYLGGLALDRFGDYSLMWYADMGLAALAAVVNLPIVEPDQAGAPAAS